MKNYRAIVEAQARRLHRLGIKNTAPRERVAAQAVRLAAVWRDDPGLALALDLGGAAAVSTLVRMREAATNPVLRAWAMTRGAR